MKCQRCTVNDAILVCLRHKPPIAPQLCITCYRLHNADEHGGQHPPRKRRTPGAESSQAHDAARVPTTPIVSD